ncbi:hypothetical protein J7384_18410 [Endozoicomonas sp. G2_1]|uniref:hypothetical protein n=1 Tax=Endozoicomonas sp. G2_1 TaxID=2821091 RepID=UPI001ADAFB2A|nr:hypothetical protein [Endozoicomonas sp. G2_1]MBO9492341.1 hypothetical protein [Endozoicomonas sp. G2_1]
MEVNCSNCRIKIDSNNINVSKDTAYCDSCESLTSLSSLLESTPSSTFDTAQPVKGVQVLDNGYKWSIEASNRSLMAIFLVPFTLVWAGGSLSNIYGTQLLNSEFDPVQSLFGLPFLIGSIVLTSITLMSLFGRTYVSNDNGKALVFIGIGSIGWYRRFDWINIDRVTESESSQNKHISLEGSKRLNLGWGLSSEKLYYMSNFLKMKLKR